ncbi:hypothetical protein C8R46DRAFT_1098127 [Mycena filopes]|nr:hypothetical protein C8R46DRAFT_1098127 [Mycena filopes]
MADPSNGHAFPQATALPQAAPTGFREFSPSALGGAFVLTAVLATLSCALMFKIEPRRLDVCRTMVFQVFTKLPLVLAQIGYAKFLVPLDSVALFWLFGGILAFVLRNVQSPPRRLGQIPLHGILSIITFSFWSDIFYMGPSIQYESAIIAQRVARGLRTAKLTWKQTNRCVHKSTIYYAAKIMLPRSVQLLFRPVIQHLADLQVLPEWIPEPKLEPLHRTPSPRVRCLSPHEPKQSSAKPFFCRSPSTPSWQHLSRGRPCS